MASEDHMECFIGGRNNGLPFHWPHIRLIQAHQDLHCRLALNGPIYDDSACRLVPANANRQALTIHMEQ